jgi:hypothetical protein
MLSLISVSSGDHIIKKKPISGIRTGPHAKIYVVCNSFSKISFGTHLGPPGYSVTISPACNSVPSDIKTPKPPVRLLWTSTFGNGTSSKLFTTSSSKRTATKSKIVQHGRTVYVYLYLYATCPEDRQFHLGYSVGILRELLTCVKRPPFRSKIQVVFVLGKLV